MGILVSEPSSRAPAPLVEQLRERLEVEENSRQHANLTLQRPSLSMTTRLRSRLGGSDV